MTRFHPSVLKTALANSLISVTNALADLAREKPKWVVIELSGKFPVREKKRKLLDFPPEFGPKMMSLETFANYISQLCEADFLEGVLVRFESLELDLFTAYMLRLQLKRLKEAGKHLLVHAGQLSLSSYYLASVAELAMPESAELNVLGLALEKTFLKDALARFGLAAEKVAIKEYKSAGDDLVRSQMSEADREQLSALLEGFEQRLYSDIAESRKVDSAEVKSWIDSGLSSAEAAKARGMIDHVAYEDELMKEAYLMFAEARRFLKQKRRSLKPGRVAVITLEGAIMPGKSRRSPVPLPLLGGTFAGSESLIAAFRTAEADETSKAIVFYVDSGGGSALASDLIWREVKRINPKKPIVAVMGQYAASGGYYVLSHARHIIAAPMTLTGSIGVVATKLLAEAFNEKYGINVEAIQRGRYARIFSSAKPLDAEERAYLERSIAEVYERFISRVAEGRKLTKERVNELGRGRIWTGQAALEHHLLDELGDIFTGIERAKELAHLAPDAQVYSIAVPKKYVLPEFESAEALLKSLNPLFSEKTCLMQAELLRWQV